MSRALPPPLLLLLPLVYLCARGGSEAVTRRAPWFTLEPPPLVRFVAGRGARVACAARGDPPPALAWQLPAGDALPLDPSLRTYENGTLEVSPAGGGGGGAAAALTVRCRAANAYGVALSREVTLQPVVESEWEVAVVATAAAAGGVAALACRVHPAAAGALVSVERWYRAGAPLDLAAPSQESRHVAAGEWLLIRDVTAADGGPYACVARHHLTALSKRSRAAHLALTGAGAAGDAAPRLAAGSGDHSAAAGAHVCLPCVASNHPPPHYTWYRAAGGRLQPSEGVPGGGWPWAGGAALCFRDVTRAAAGAWLCKAYNVFGDATSQVRLAVRDELTVTVEPPVASVEAGGTVRFSCTASDDTAALSWVHDGAAAGAGPALVVRGVARAHRGVYQCVARRDQDSAQAAAELRLAGAAPELQYTFIEQALRASGGVSLRCAAWGVPPPRVLWLLDGAPLDTVSAPARYAVSEETSAAGDVVSALNISSVAPADGGRYTCRAHNDRGRADHSARLNIYGPPAVRARPPVRVVAGSDATIYCPYAGYPISSISWRRGGARADVGGAGRVSARGDALRLAPALPADAGHYACSVAAPAASAAPPASRDLQILVLNPPKISPFMFSAELTEGSAVQVLCGVSSGDKPLYFSWLKDGAPLPADLQIEEKSLNEFSLLMFPALRARHSGEYTCRVTNHAATASFSATLNVKVAPAWVTEPLDAAVLLGAPLLLECAARGHPTPAVTWFRRVGVSEGGEQWQAVTAAWGGRGAGAGGAQLPLRTRDGVLGVPAAARAHQGLYRCTVDNGVGPPLLKHVNVTVHEPAHFEGSGGNVSAVRGRGAALTCAARGDPPLSLYWTHRGARLDLDSYRWTVSEVRAGAALRSTLSLRAAERADAGEYRCHAANRFGRGELALYLHVEEPPDAPRDLRLRGVGTRWVRVAWRTAAGAGGARYLASCAPLAAPPAAPVLCNLTLDSDEGDDESNGSDLRWASGQLEGLRPATAYSVQLAAANHAGRSPLSEPLAVSTLEAAPGAAPRDVRARPAPPGLPDLLLSWSETWNGELLGYAVTWRDSEGGTGRRSVAGAASLELELSEVRGAARLEVAVRAYNRAGAGPPSPAVHLTVPDGGPEEPPASVTCEPVSAHSLRVRWAAPERARSLRTLSYDVHYAPVRLYSPWSDTADTLTVRGGGGATLQELLPATNYSVWVRTRAETGVGPPAPPVYCATSEDVPGAVETLRALAAAADAVRVTWLAPPRPAGRITHYTLHTRELGKAGGERAQRVEPGEAEEEVWREVRGLRAAVYEVWVRAATAVGAGPPSRPVTAAPALPASAQISSFSRAVSAVEGARVRLTCTALGMPPLHRRWTPLPPTHTLTDNGDLILHKVEAASGGNYTCSVNNAGGVDAVAFTVAVRRRPGAPSARLVRAASRALHVAWDTPPDGGAPLLAYTVAWAREEGEEEGLARVPASDAALVVRGLACGARYRVTVRAHSTAGDSPPSRPLLARTRGDRAGAAPGAEFVWANSSALRLNLLAWRAPCGVRAWTVAVRTPPAPWRDLPTDGESAEAGGLAAGAWHEVRVVARAWGPPGDTAALYRAPTLTLHGESIGEAMEVVSESEGATRGAGRGTGAGGAWIAPLLLAGALGALLAALAGGVLARYCGWCGRYGRCGRCGRCGRGAQSPRLPAPHPQLYSTEPVKRNGKTLTPPDGSLEISPYATFSMSEGATSPAAAGCALHLHTFARADLPRAELAAPPPRPNLLAHAHDDGIGRDSDSESSGSPCAACAAERHRGSVPRSLAARRRRGRAARPDHPTLRMREQGGYGGTARRRASDGLHTSPH